MPIWLAHDQTQKMTKKLIVDLDIGTDDAVALMLLLAAHYTNKIKIEAISCVNGNAAVHDVIRNTIRLLETVNEHDIPVYKGCQSAFIPVYSKKIDMYHGIDGFGDMKHDREPDISVVKKEIASVAIGELVTNNPGEITLICLGPLTNIALAIKLFPNFMRDIKELYSMGGNYKARGNTTPSAEFNFWIDPEAAFIVVENVVSPTTIVPWETCIETSISTSWRFGEVAAIRSPFMNLLTKAEKSLVFADPNIWICCDAMLVATFLNPSTIVASKEMHVTVELFGIKTRGQVVIDHLGEEEPNVTMVTKVDEELFKEMVIDAAKVMQTR